MSLKGEMKLWRKEQTAIVPVIYVMKQLGLAFCTFRQTNLAFASDVIGSSIGMKRGRLIADPEYTIGGGEQEDGMNKEMKALTIRLQKAEDELRQVLMVLWAAADSAGGKLRISSDSMIRAYLDPTSTLERTEDLYTGDLTYTIRCL